MSTADSEPPSTQPDPAIQVHIAALSTAAQAEKFAAAGHRATARACWHEASRLAEEAARLTPRADRRGLFLRAASSFALRAHEHTRASLLARRGARLVPPNAPRPSVAPVPPRPRSAPPSRGPITQRSASRSPTPSPLPSPLPSPPPPSS